MKQEHGAYRDGGLRFKYIAVTDKGRVRSKNDDNFLVNTAKNFFAVADGVGSLAGSDTANLIALEIINKKYQKPAKSYWPFFKNTSQDKHRDHIDSVLQVANHSIYNCKRRSGNDMATTIVSSFFFGNKCIVAHAGDSRFYKIHENSIEQITTDHSLKNEILRKGGIKPDTSKINIPRNIITRAFGADATVQCDFNEIILEPLNFFMLCTDGLTSMLDADAISAIVCNQHLDLYERGHKLVESANKAGGKDNITVLLLQVSKK